MQCPACKSTMSEQTYESVKINICAACEGVWLDEGEIVRIIDDRKASFSLEQKLNASVKPEIKTAHAQRFCPKCKAALATHAYAYDSGVYIDRCPQKHGMFLDKEELQHIEIYFENQTGSKDTNIIPKNGPKLCPRDGSVLLATIYETEELDQCPTCSGIWCDDNELGKIVQSRLQAIPPSYQPTPGLALKLSADCGCPVCNQKLRTSLFGTNSSITIDNCPAGHGVWLDYKELEQIQAYTEFWEAQEPVLKKAWMPRIEKAAKVGAEKYDRAVKEGVADGLKHTAPMRMLRKMRILLGSSK